jgi:hypothetical protein
MIWRLLAYRDIQALVATGRLVVIAPGQDHAGPRCVLQALPLTHPGSARIARSRDEQVRVGQMLGALHVVREHYRADGFTPA